MICSAWEISKVFTKKLTKRQTRRILPVREIEDYIMCQELCKGLYKHDLIDFHIILGKSLIIIILYKRKPQRETVHDLLQGKWLGFYTKFEWFQGLPAYTLQCPITDERISWRRAQWYGKPVMFRNLKQVQGLKQNIGGKREGWEQKYWWALIS